MRNKKLEAEQHNRAYEKKKQTTLAYEIMRAEGLDTRDYLQVRENDRKARAKAMQLMILTSALSNTVY